MNVFFFPRFGAEATNGGFRGVFWKPFGLSADPAAPQPQPEQQPQPQTQQPAGFVGPAFPRRAEYRDALSEIRQRLAKEERQEQLRELSELEQYIEREETRLEPSFDRLTESIEAFKAGQEQIQAIAKQIQELARRIVEQDEDDALAAILMIELR